MNNAAAYRNELQKQTDPYAYFLRQEEHRERGRSIAVDGPLPCNIVPNIPGLIAETYTLPDFKKTYVILKTDRITTYENAVPALFYSACSTDAETPDHVLPEVIYCDHDYRDPDGKRHTPFLKPDYSPHTLLSENYMGEFAAFGFELLDGILNDPEEPFTAGEMPAD
ncbi:MAG: hypothetical protein IJU25_00205, partial [Lachnospiraceae bacterium]|nr:hypothetical protein [Lachnospiraceae bacterium]